MSLNVYFDTKKWKIIWTGVVISARKKSNVQHAADHDAWRKLTCNSRGVGGGIVSHFLATCFIGILLTYRAEPYLASYV